MPKVDSSILSKKDKILSDIEKIIDPKNVLSWGSVLPHLEIIFKKPSKK